MSRLGTLTRLADLAPVRWWLRRLPTWNGVLTLNYHRVGDAAAHPWDRTLWSASERQFEDQLSVLAREFDVIGPEDVATAAASRGRHVLLTFDDGYRDNYELAFPLLRSHGLSATFFLATGFIDEPHVAWWDEIAWMARRSSRTAIPAGEWLSAPVSLGGHDHDAGAAELVRVYKGLPQERTGAYLDFLAEITGAGRCGTSEAAGMWMTWDMAREMRDAGMTIGGHTVSHPILARIPIGRQEEEIAGCAARLRQELGQPMRWFGYPVGSPDSFSADTKNLLRDAGVEMAFSFYGGYLNATPADRFDIPRIHVGPRMDKALLRLTLALPQRLARPD